MITVQYNENTMNWNVYLNNCLYDSFATHEQALRFRFELKKLVKVGRA